MSILVFLIGVIMIAAAILVVSMALSGEKPATGVNRSLAALEAIGSAPEEMKAELDRPFADRVMAPLQARALALGRRLSGGDTSERIRHKLDLAGNPRDWSPDRVVSGKVIGAIALFAVGVAFGLVLHVSPGLHVALAIGGLVLGFLVPDLYLYQVAYDRGNKLQRALPDAIDLLTISVESGLGFDAAVQQVARNTTGPLADEFSRMLREMQIGSGRSEALRGMAARSNVPELKSFAGAMVQADSFGIPIAQVLRVQSSEMRVKRRQRAEEKAQQVPVKITVPLIFCILPTLLIAVMGPAVIHIIDNFNNK